MEPSVRMSDVVYVAQKLHAALGIEYVVLDAGRHPLRIARFKDSTDASPDIIEFHSLQAAYEYLVEVCATYLMLWSAG